MFDVISTPMVPGVPSLVRPPRLLFVSVFLLGAFLATSVAIGATAGDYLIDGGGELPDDIPAAEKTERGVDGAFTPRGRLGDTGDVGFGDPTGGGRYWDRGDAQGELERRTRQREVHGEPEFHGVEGLRLGMYGDAVGEDRGPPYWDVVRGLDLTVDPTTKIGASAARLRSGLNLDLSAGVPWIQRGGRPEDYMTKLGPLYLDIWDVEGTVLHSDNANLSENDPVSDVGEVVTVGMGAVLQLTEGLRLAAYGDFVYLPSQGRAGFDGFGISDRLELAADVDVFSADFVSAGQIGRWDVAFVEAFRVRDVGDRWADFVEELDMLEQRRLEETEVVGRYDLYTPGRQETDDDRSLETRFTDRDVVSQNTVAVVANRVLPTITRCTFSVYRHDYWYSEDRAGREDWRRGAGVSLVSERETMRFLPYASYGVTEESDDRGWDHVARAGFFGPITDYIDFRGDVGYYLDRSEDRDQRDEDRGHLWRLTLRHNPNRLTWHRVSYERFVGELDDDLRRSLTYHLYRIWGPQVGSGFVTGRQWVEEGQTGGNGRARDFVGGRLVYIINPKMATRLTYTVEHERPYGDGSTVPDSRERIALFEIRFRLTETLRLSLAYQNRQRDSEAVGDSFTENLVLLRLKKILRWTPAGRGDRGYGRRDRRRRRRRRSSR